MLGRTVGEIESGMGAYELGEWKRLCAEEVLGDERSDYWQAQMLSAYCNVHRDRTVHPSLYDPKDFLPRRVPLNDDSGARDDGSMLASLEQEIEGAGQCK